MAYSILDGYNPLRFELYPFYSRDYLFGSLDRPQRTYMGEDDVGDFTMEILRRWAGINESYDQLDAQLEETMAAAVNRVSEMIGTSATSATRHDLYADWRSEFRLAERRQTTMSKPVVKYRDDSGTVQTLADTEYAVDDTGITTRLIFDPTRTEALDDDAALPIEVTYTVGAAEGMRGYQVKEACRQAYELMMGASPRRNALSWNGIRRLVGARAPASSRKRVIG